MSKREQFPARARIDQENEFPGDIADRVYSDEFLAGLGKKFNLNLTIEVRRELHRMAQIYIANLRLGTDDSWDRTQRRRYRQLKSAASRFAKTIKAFEDDDIASHLFMTVRVMENEALLGDKLISAQRNMPHNRTIYPHIMNLIDLIGEAAECKVKEFIFPRGPKGNPGLHSMTMHAIALWQVDFGRRFTVDYHKGSGLTDAFQFMRALIDPLDDVSDQQIITAMRHAIKLWRDGEKRRSSRPKSRSQN